MNKLCGPSLKIRANNCPAGDGSRNPKEHKVFQQLAFRPWSRQVEPLSLLASLKINFSIVLRPKQGCRVVYTVQVLQLEFGV